MPFSLKPAGGACKKKQCLERLIFTFTPKGKREFVTCDQVLPLIFVNC